MTRFKLVCVLLASLSGCAPGVFLPESGPTTHAIKSGPAYVTPQAAQLPYVLVNLDSRTVPYLPRDTGAALDFPLVETGRSAGLIGVGDLIGVTIFESGSGGLFLPREPGTRAGNFVNLPSQQVDQAGNISIPYGGLIRAVGRTPTAVQNTIQERLASRALEPQVVVSIIDRRADAVTVVGDVNATAHFSLDPGGERLLGAIARAGGPKFPAYEEMVTVQRNGQARRALLSDLATDPRKNIEMRAGDSVFISHEPRFFLALGATGLAGGIGLIDRRIPFGDYHITLADAMAKSGGLQDPLAHAKGVFVYRMEPRENVLALGIDPGASLASKVATIYVVDLTQPTGMFFAQAFPMHQEDLMYVSNAPATDIAKFLSILGAATGSSSGIATTIHP